MLPITREMAPERAGGGGGLSRPFVLAVVLLILFLTLQADWNAANSRREGRRGSALYSSGAAGDGVGGVGVAAEMGGVGSAVHAQSAYNKDRLILDLQRMMRKLEDENSALRIEVLSLKTSAAFCGGDGAAGDAGALVDGSADARDAPLDADESGGRTDGAAVDGAPAAKATAPPAGADGKDGARSGEGGGKR